MREPYMPHAGWAIDPDDAAWLLFGLVLLVAALSGWSTVRFQLNGIGATAAFNDIRYRVVTP
jgi:hypothetical protein